MALVTIPCYGCGLEIPDDELSILDCAPTDEERGSWKNVLICDGCFRRLDPDMWISSNCWAGIKPNIPFDELPDMCAHEMNWLATRIEEVRVGPHHQKMIQELREKKDKS